MSLGQNGRITWQKTVRRRDIRTIPTIKPKPSCNCGASGCVIYPAVQCANSKCVGKNKSNSSACPKLKATKLFFNDESYKKEIEIFNKNNSLLKKIDTNEDFFLSQYEECTGITRNELYKNKCYFDVDKHGVKVNVPIYSEAFLIEHPWLYDESINSNAVTDNLKSISFSYLGENMHLCLNKLKLTDVSKFIKSIENIFKAIDLLNTNNIYHCDLKPLNIVLHNNKFKLIDFGSAVFSNQVMDKGREIGEGYTPGYISPEYFYFLTKQMWLPFMFKNHEIEYNEDDKHITFKLNIYDYVKVEGVSKFIDKELEGQTMPIAYYENLRTKTPKNCYLKTDIWSMGCILKQVLNHIVSLFNSSEYIDDNEKSIVDEEDIEDDEAFFDNDLIKKIIVGLNDVIKNLLILDVYNRPNAKLALTIYQVFLRSLQPKLTVGERKIELVRKRASRSSIQKEASRSGRSGRSGRAIIASISGRSGISGRSSRQTGASGGRKRNGTRKSKSKQSRAIK